MDYNTKLIIFLYFAFNSVRVFSYIPQIIAVAKDKTEAKAISIITWSFWTMANFTTALYALFVAHDQLLALMSFGNTLGCGIVIAIVCYKRKKYKTKVTSKQDFILADDKDVLNVFVK